MKNVTVETNRDEGDAGFIVQAAKQDLAAGRFGYIRTRFAPEPNAYIHIGSAISTEMTFGLAETLGGTYNLRFDDTNPQTERTEFVDAIRSDLHWLGYEWDGEFFASDYFEQLYQWAVQLIEAGKAYVCDLDDGRIREMRGTNVFDKDGRRITPPGIESPYRNRSVEENHDLFERMRNGEFADGERTLRAKIDMSHDNLLMRDPIMYRIVHAHHHRTGDDWCIYPTYDWAHGQSDSIEGITHSICGLEFRAHRPLYDWYLDELGIHHPRQIEYTRINLSYTITGKRYLKALVEGDLVRGWDDPRLPTLRALRRRGIPPTVIREFCRRLSISDRKRESTLDIEFFDHIARERLNIEAPRFMAVLRPLKVIITNYPEGKTEMMSAVNNPEDPDAGNREAPFSRELYIERDDFLEDPPKKFYRLAPGREVRLRYAYFITCTGVKKDPGGTIREIHCTYDPATRGGRAPDGRKVKATLHWVSAPHAVKAEVRLYDRLFTVPDPLGEGDTWMDSVAEDSVTVIDDAVVEPGLASVPPEFRCQFERLGYFCADPDGTEGHPVFDRTLALRDEWRRIRDKG